jgi:DNA ligase-associated metallophosphoesterase
VSVEAAGPRHAFEPRGDGGVGIRLAGTSVVCLPSGALWLAAERTLVVADLHLEKGSAYARRGQMLPPYDTRDTLDRLEAQTRILTPRAIVLLGDTFHDAEAEGRLAGEDRARLVAIAALRDLVWVIGNHDRAGPVGLPGAVVAGLTLGGLDLTHEPADGASRAEVAGHFHPCARVRSRGGSVRRRCFVTDGQRMILPAFGALTGGLNVRDPALATRFHPRPLALVLGSDRVHPVAWSSLRGD